MKLRLGHSVYWAYWHLCNALRSCGMPLLGACRAPGVPIRSHISRGPRQRFRAECACSGRPGSPLGHRLGSATAAEPTSEPTTVGVEVQLRLAIGTETLLVACSQRCSNLLKPFLCNLCILCNQSSSAAILMRTRALRIE